ncbi:hypothetical protein Tco_0776193 [Tanacetum coccineum]
MAIKLQSMDMYLWEIKEKLVERREQIGIRAYEEDKRREELNQKIEEVKNLIQSFIQNPISPPITTKVPAKRFKILHVMMIYQNKKTMGKGVGKEGFACTLNKSKGSRLGLEHCAANKKGNGLSCGRNQSLVL